MAKIDDGGRAARALREILNLPVPAMLGKYTNNPAQPVIFDVTGQPGFVYVTMADQTTPAVLNRGIGRVPLQAYLRVLVKKSNTGLIMWGEDGDRAAPLTTPPDPSGVLPHAASHLSGGSDPLVSLTAVANGVPQAAGDGYIDIGWIDPAEVPAGPAGPTGATGATGATGVFGGNSVAYTFSTTTADSDPGSGVLRFNHATFASITQIFADDNDANAADIQAWLGTLAASTNTVKGFIRIFKKSDESVFRIFSMSATTETTGYWKITVTPIVQNGTLIDADAIVLTFARTGDLGATGATGPTGATGATGADGTLAIHAASSKATPIGADELGYLDSTAAFALVKMTFTQLVTWLTTLFVDKTTNQTVAGDKTLTGTTTVGAGTGSPILKIAGGAGGTRLLAFLTSALSRWGISTSSTAESGSNAGSDFVISSYDDAGAALRTDLIITRVNGLWTLGGPLVVPEPASGVALSVGRRTSTANVKATTDHMIIDGLGSGGLVSLQHYTSGNVLLAIGGGKTGLGISPTVALHVLGVGSGAAMIIDAASTAYNDTGGLARFIDDNDREVVIGGLGMFRRDVDADNGDLRFNFLGYNGGATRYRDYKIYDGKGTLVLNVDGSAGGIGIAGEDAPEGQLHGDGFMWVKKTGIVGTKQVIIANVSGDVTKILTGFYTLSDGTTGVSNAISMTPTPSTDAIAVGGSTWTLTLATNGEFSVIRTAGSGTATMTFMLTWI